MKSFLAIIVYILCLHPVYAITVNININGDNVKYENARLDKGNYISTASEFVSNLEPTSSWLPASSSKELNFNLFGPDKKNASLHVQLTGLEFDWAGSSSNSDSINNTVMGLESGICNTYILAGTKVQLTSDSSSCISNRFINSASELNPFYFVRPIFKVHSFSTLTGLPEGVYVGSEIIKYRYYYYNKHNVFTYRELSFDLTFQISYTPSVFSSLEVVAENGGIIEPKYETDKVKGETKYNVVASGFFDTGIKMKFDTGGNYSLIHESDSTSIIPYYIHCSTCDNKVIVGDDGKVVSAVLSSSGIVNVPVGGNHNTISFDLVVGYRNREFNEVITGRYSASFNVIFGLDF
ncbi:hypothetical protein [Shewanella sp. UCD-KL12]|uniref:hypothetical protein n=1 Tax=Shewanella sp. UCD-KL12 TaxID=1917163 RepID=UPI000970D8D1|nr:hypothetical protein [Shewanella sp. UCD-KL12]